MDELVRKIYQTIRRERLFAPRTVVALGVSGGADSVALLRALHELADPLALRLTVAHFNHGWRGAESDADEAFVAGLAARLGLPFRAGRAAAVAGANREAEARQARYDFLFSAAADAARETPPGGGEPSPAAVAVAHHADDQAETLLINLLRGAGPDGLSGMAAAGPGPGKPAPGRPALRLVRPLLEITRAELRDYLGRLGQDFREDSSNQDPNFLRNRIRHELLPLLATFNPAIARTLGRTAEVMREEAEALSAFAKEWRDGRGRGGARLDLRGYPDLPAGLRRRVLREALRRLDPGLARIARDHVAALDRLALSPDHGRLDLPGITAVKTYDDLSLTAAEAGPAVVGRSESSGEELPLARPGGLTWAGPRGPVVIRAELTDDATVSDPFAAALLDPAAIRGPLHVRSRRPGDRYAPAGMSGRRRLKDVFNELRVPPADRDRWPLVEDEGKIVWVPGMRSAKKPDPGSGQKVIKITITPALMPRGDAREEKI